MSRRPRFQAIRGAMTWKDAIEWWDKGRPDMVALLISEEPIPEQLRDAVAAPKSGDPYPPRFMHGFCGVRDGGGRDATDTGRFGVEFGADQRDIR